MNILVLVAGVADPKWPLEPASEAALPPRQAERLVLSPFDEAALELALRARDQLAGAATLSCAVVGGPETEKLARSVFALTSGPVVRLEAQPGLLWDQSAVAGRLAEFARALVAPPDLVLIGREFGDCDDGLVPPALAETLGWGLCALVQDIATTDGCLRLMRERGGQEEWIAPAGPAVASVTNDRRNRLRKPLVKNVMAARQVQIATADGRLEPSPKLSLEGAAAGDVGRPRVACRVLGGALEEQVAALATLLKE